MKQGQQAYQAVVLILAVLILLFSGCKRETNTSGNPEVGQATGAAANNAVLKPDQKEYNPDTTTIPSPEGYQNMVPTIPSGHRNLDRNGYMDGCQQLCTTGKQAKAQGHDAAFCDNYCGCSYQKMRDEVPISNLRAYVRGEVSSSTDTIHGIIKQCLTVAQHMQQNEGKPSAAKLNYSGNPEASGTLGQPNSAPAGQPPAQ